MQPDHSAGQADGELYLRIVQWTVQRRVFARKSWFTDIDQARSIIEEWRDDYNRLRPHGSLGALTPKEVARLFKAQVFA